MLVLRAGLLFIVILSLLTACGGDSGGVPAQSRLPPPPPPSPPPPPVQAQFTSATLASGIDYTNGLSDVTDPAEIGIIASSAAAAGDYDGDGDIDLLIVRGDVGPNLLYRNSGNMVFEDVAPAAGLA